MSKISFSGWLRTQCCFINYKDDDKKQAFSFVDDTTLRVKWATQHSLSTIETVSPQKTQKVQPGEVQNPAPKDK